MNILYLKETVNNQVIKKYLCGILKVISCAECSEYLLFNVTILKTKNEFYRKQFVILGLSFKKFFSPSQALKQIFSQITDGYDSIYYISCGTGEGYILANHFDEIIKNNNSKKPYVIVRNKALFSIFNIFNPKLNKKIFMLENDLDFRKFCKNKYKYRGKNIYIFFPTKHFFKQDKILLNSKKKINHFYFYLCNLLKLNNLTDIKINNYDKTFNIITNAQSKVVLFAPEANACKMYNPEFYFKLEKLLMGCGYNVIWNVTKCNTVYESKKTFELTHEQIINIAINAKAVIGLRSGLFDILSTIKNTQLHVLYTDFHDKGVNNGCYYSSKAALKAFTLKEMPCVHKENIFEYDTNTISEVAIIQKIMELLS